MSQELERLQRFKDAQNESDAGFDEALAEIRRGRKQGHWIWYIFPQLRGLGRSAMSETFGIDGEAEAIAYVRDAQLRTRLLTIATALIAQRERGVDLRTVMGSSLDAAKVVSSMTLFAEVARTLRDREACAECAQLAHAAQTILEWGAAEGIGACEYTRRLLSGRRGQ
jgi:uncharacterized protein (DUF1810 family)